MPYKSRLFSCVGYLKKQQEPILSVLYNYLSDNTHNGLMIWDIVPKAILYDQERRRKPIAKQTKQYEEFNKNMLNEILGEWEGCDVCKDSDSKDNIVYESDSEKVS